MGNASGKEDRDGRQQSPPYPSQISGGRSASSPQSHSHSAGPYSPDGGQIVYASRHGRGSRSELSTLLGLGGGPSARDDRTPEAILEQRRETKAERETRRLERERANRERERERSMREESVDGGYLVTQGVYTGIEDFSKPVVRQLMIERRLAPFWRGLNDHSESWTEHQLVAAARGLPVPAADEIPEVLEQQQQQHAKEDSARDELAEQTMKSLTVPMGARSASSQSEQSNISRSTPHHATFPVSSSPPPSGGSLLRGRAKTLASLTTSNRNVSQSDLQPREMHLPKDPNVNGQPIEAYLYKDASECPICFLYYPPYLNHTRCCDQPICSECFVQIKRPDPHPPEHPDPNDPQHANEQAQEIDGLLVSEPSQCPYCAQPEFGITYEPLQFRRGLTYVNPTGTSFGRSTPMSSSSSLDALATSGKASPAPQTRRRAGSLPVSAPQVISTDRVRPDWATKLASARAHQARRSAAATALHTAAYLMNGRNSPDARGLPGFGRRVIMRRGTGDSPGDSSANLSGINFAFGEAQPTRRTRGFSEGDEPQYEGLNDGSSPTMLGPPRHASRRTRVEDLEEMMMMEAIRLSLASEEERRRKEEKEARKDAKKRAKEDKKAEKAARKAGVYMSSGNPSFGTMGSSSASVNVEGSNSKGKAIAREGTPDSDSPEAYQLSRSAPQYGSSGSQSESAQNYLERSRAQLMPDGTATNLTSPLRPSHLRNLSNVSSDTSSLADGSPGEAASPGVPLSGGSEQGSAGLEPMFNFRSLAQMIGDEEKAGASAAEHLEDTGQSSRHASEDAGALEKHPQTDLASSELPESHGEDAGLEKSVATLTPRKSIEGSQDTTQEGDAVASADQDHQLDGQGVQAQHGDIKAHETVSTVAAEAGSV